MRNRQLFSCVAVTLALACAVLAQQAGRRATSYKDLKYPALNKSRIPEPVRFELPNGMVVFLIEDHEVPMISISAMVRAGGRWEPAGKVGLASITGTVMRTGGTATRSGDQLDEELDRLGASVETSIEDNGRATVSVLKEDFDEGLSILADILQHPAFPQDKIDLAKIAERDEIARRNDSPGEIVSREFRSVIYGKDSPLARQPEYATIDAITRDDLIAFHKQFFQPESVILAAWGDFKADEIRGKIERAFGSWQRGGHPKPAAPEIDPAARNRAGFYSINKGDMQQSWVVMGMLGVQMSDPDYAAIRVMNQILGGGFSSRLFSQVRSEQGLAYSVYSRWQSGWDVPGTFTAAGSTKPQTTVKLYQSIRHEIERLAEGGATDNELALAKDGILKSSAFDYASTGAIAGRLMTYEYWGYPKDFFEQSLAKVEKTTKADVARVAKEYLKPEQFAVMILGNEKGYDAPLSSLGVVKAIDISIPQPKQKELAAATPEAASKGKALLAAARDAMGGAALLKVKDFSTKGDLNMETPQGPMTGKVEITFNLSGKMLNKMELPMGEMSMGYDGQSGWMRMGENTRDLPDAQKIETAGAFFRATLSLLQNFENAGYSVQALGSVEFDGRKVEAVGVSDTARQLQVKVYIDPASGLIVGKQFTAALMMGPPAETEEVYSDYREVSGVKVPFKTVTRQGGKARFELTVAEVKINPGVEDSAYKKP